MFSLLLKKKVNWVTRVREPKRKREENTIEEMKESNSRQQHKLTQDLQDHLERKDDALRKKRKDLGKIYIDHFWTSHGCISMQHDSPIAE